MEKEKGWISLYRQFVNWEWYDDANTMRLFIHCLLLANFEDKKWRGKLIKRGSFITSYPKLAYSLKLSIKQIRGSLTKLKTTGEVAVQPTPEYSIITVKNYDLYQDEGRLKGRQKTTERQTRGRQRATTNNINNREIIINNNLSLCEREILKKYLLSRKRKEPIYDIDAYISLMDKNGSLKDKLEKALKWNEKQKQENVITFTPPEKVEQTPEEREKIAELIKKAKGNITKIRKGD